MSKMAAARARPRGSRKILAAIGSAFALNALFVFGNFLETPWALLPAQVSGELVVLVAALWLFATLSMRLPGWAAWFLAAVLLIAFLIRLADILVPWFFGRTFIAAVDLKYVPFFVGLLHDALTTWQFSLYLGGSMLAVAGALVLLRALVGGIARTIGEGRSAAFAFVWAAAALAYPLVPARSDLGPYPAATPIAAVVWRNVEFALEAGGVSGGHAAVLRGALAQRPTSANVMGLGRRNVLLIFIESYGAVAFTDSEMRAALAPEFAHFETRVRGAGYQIYSNVLDSPTVGGGSWMAHATLLTGIRLDTQLLYEAMLASEIRSLAHSFREAGYRTVAVMPRLQEPWLHGAFFGFERVIDDAALGYRGPRFAWATMPDQFVLERAHTMELAQAARPLFIKYVLASSHLPFDHTPPLIDDAHTIGDGSAYVGRDGEHHPPPGGQMFENRAGYIAAIRYVLRSLEAYLVDRLAGDSLVIMLGDHQPPLRVAAATRNKAVPIHILSRDSAVLAPFAHADYAPGFVPSRATAEAGMESFADWLFQSFGGTVGRGETAVRGTSAVPE